MEYAGAIRPIPALLTEQHPLRLQIPYKRKHNNFQGQELEHLLSYFWQVPHEIQEDVQCPNSQNKKQIHLCGNCRCQSLLHAWCLGPNQFCYDEGVWRRSLLRTQLNYQENWQQIQRGRWNQSLLWSHTRQGCLVQQWNRGCQVQIQKTNKHSDFMGTIH